MGNRTVGISIVMALFIYVPALDAQVSTERYIPVGQSPGLSGVSTYIGEILAVDGQNRTVTVRNGPETRSVALTSETRVWLDRSLLRQQNTTGNVDDLLVGRTVEVKYEDAEAAERADWIKIVIDSE